MYWKKLMLKNIYKLNSNILAILLEELLFCAIIYLSSNNIGSVLCKNGKKFFRENLGIFYKKKIKFI